VAPHQKKADKNGLTLTIGDESGFSFVPNCNRPWAPIGQTPLLRETPGRHNHTGLGFITRTPRRHLLKFRFSIFKGAARFEDFVFHLTELHHCVGTPVLMLWDHLLAHHSAETYFRNERPAWFVFEHFPSYSPELNPVESCWQRMKNVYLPNFVPKTDDELASTVYTAAMRINEERQLPSCFKKANIPP
jgi:transposase